MRRALVHLVLIATSASPCFAQGPFAVGTRDVSWPNPTGQGSATLAARVLYPATSTGSDTPLLPQPGGWPAVVFLHGFALLGNSYVPLGTAWAQQGFVVVLSNTMQFDNAGQALDGRALFFALQAANATAGGPFQGGLDLQRVAIAGHSMGGGNCGNVLAANPGYRCGVAIAPVPPVGGNAAAVAVPFGIVAGAGDTITPPATNAQPFYSGLTGYGGMKFLYLLNGDATHTNLAGLFVSGATSAAVFGRAAAVGLGFLRHALDLSVSGLDEVIGPPALAEPRLVSLSQEFADVQTWTDGPLRIGASMRASGGMEPGIGGIAAAFAAPTAPLPTPFGDLRLDPTSAFVLAADVVGAGRRLDAAIALPPAPPLLGLPLGLQTLGPTRTQPLWFGNAIGLAVVP